ncbi:mechanosensitive ion channel [Microbulbifer sp. OS29]|uniref:Mechanosensitive ion channel n=1 Tax=Microbulbifer okhotskensis TaxID=2926617 RepID=A0A9X2ES11_9GAMM|nr:mechanosensitive ion channel domain-containing protein [Microbulbifer okhotskensis]MCO1334686.1 mechanosensitive ion channel [Microbulbifer okhotskensis]
MVGVSFLIPLRIARREPYLLRLLLLVLLISAAACLSVSASAQLPGTKPKEFQPVVPDFADLSADWWTGWTKATPGQRREWLAAVQKSWQTWEKELPEDEALQEGAKKITQSLDGIEITWNKREEYLKVSLMPDVEFPQNPTVLEWAKADAAISRGRRRLKGVELEARQLKSTQSQSLSLLRKQVIVLRDSSGREEDEAAQALLLAQINHLNIIEQLSTVNSFLGTWRDKIEEAEIKLRLMLDTLVSSSVDAQKIEKEIVARNKKIERISATRTSIQSTTEPSTDPIINMQKDLTLMQLEVDLLEEQLDKRKSELLQSINDVLNEEAEERPLIISRDLLENANTVIEGTSRELTVRQRQVVAWREDEEDEDLSRWWAYFERIGSGLARANDLEQDIQRYEKAQLEVYRERQGWWATVRERISLSARQAYNRWRKLADYQLFTIAQNPITPRLIAKIIVVLVGARLLSGLTLAFLRRLVRRQHASESSMYNLGRVLHYSFIAVALIVVFSMLGLDTSKLALVAGALSVGIGFGLQAIFSNFISGLILLFERPLKVGDLVELESGVFGRIRDINVRSTRITTRDNVDILVPNTEFVAGRVINHTLDDPVRRIHVSFGVSYASDPDLVREAALEAAARVNITHTDWKRKTEVWLMGFGENALDFKLVVWVNSNMVTSLGDSYALYNLELLREFREKGIEVPFPQRDLHLRSWDVPAMIARPTRK